MPSRIEIYAAIDGERAYQDRKWGGSPHDATHTTAEWARYMIEHAERVRTLMDPGERLDEVRKVAALAVACMEFQGLRFRNPRK